MKNEQEIRELLIENTIKLIAEGGFEKATTKAIAHSREDQSNLKMNEVYIYRFFESKEMLYETAFDRLDKEFFYALRRHVEKLDPTDPELESHLFEIFLRAWRFLLRNEDRCRCYIRYYHSIYFKKHSRIRHNENFAEIITAFTPLFKDEADVKAIMHSVLTTLLDFAVLIFNGDLEDNEINTPHVFNVVYSTMKLYFKYEYESQPYMH